MDGKTIFDQIAEKGAVPPEASDFTRDGVLYCGKCGSPKQKRQELPRPNGGTFFSLVPILCQCGKDNQSAVEATLRRTRFSQWMTEMHDKYRLSDMAYHGLTFAADDRREASVSDICRRYVDQWEEMLKSNIGILLYGSIGVGKTFFACAIANALQERCVPTVATSFPRLLSILQGARDRQTYVDALTNYHLLVIDDLGTERDSPYGSEQVFAVIDARSRSGLPLIITTNMSMEELKDPPSMTLRRAYDRVLEMCPVTIKMAGESRRTGNAEARRQLARELLRG